MISVIVPVYNVKLYLSDCIDSILHQTYLDFELLLIDDGSTDGSESICNKYAETDSRIRVYHKENEGIARTRNYGLSKAKGDYIAFVDSDDYILPHYLEYLVNSIEITHSDISLCYSKRFKNLNSIEKFNCHTVNYIKKSQVDIIQGLFTSTEHMAVWCKLYKRDVLKDVNFLSINIAEDVDFNSRVYLKTEKFVLVPEFLYYWRERPDSLTRSSFSLTNIDALECFLSAWENMPEENLYFQALALQRLYKVILYTRYNSPKELKWCIKKKLNYIKTKTINKFIKNKYVSFSKKIGLLTFFYFPISYVFFRMWEAKKKKR